MSAAHAAPSVTVVISTYNRAALLDGAVRSVLAQDGAPPFEVVVVDNNSTDGTRAVVAALVPESGGRLRYVFEPRQGLSYGRNAGVAAARASLVAFTDDDVRARPDWLAGVVRAFGEHPWASFVGGKVLPRWPGPVPAWLTREHWGPLALADYGPEPVRVDLDRPICLVGANLAVRRSAFDRVGPFDPAFQHRPGAVAAVEDHEWQLRVLGAGGAGLYLPDLVIEAEVQPNRLEKRYHRKWHFDHGRAFTALLGPDETLDSRMLPGASTRGRPTLFGAAPWVYRQIAVSGTRAVAALVAGRHAAALRHECVVRDALGHLVGVATRPRPARPAAT